MRARVAPVAGAAALVALPFVLSARETGRVAEVGAYVVVLVGLGALARRAGRVSFGHGAFMAAGGYATALLAARDGLSPYAALPAAAAAGALAALLAAVPVLRLPGRYYALPTLGLAIALPDVLARYGAVGLPHAPGVDAAYALAWTLAAAAAAGSLLLLRRVPRLVAAALAWSGLCAGLAGGLLVLRLGHAGAGVFPLRLSLVVVAAAAPGLSGSIAGAVLGAVALEYLPDLVALERPGPGPSTLAFGAALVVLALVSPLAIRIVRRLRS